MTKTTHGKTTALTKSLAKNLFNICKLISDSIDRVDSNASNKIEFTIAARK